MTLSKRLQNVWRQEEALWSKRVPGRGYKCGPRQMMLVSGTARGGVCLEKVSEGQAVSDEGRKA